MSHNFTECSELKANGIELYRGHNWTHSLQQHRGEIRCFEVKSLEPVHYPLLSPLEGYQRGCGTYSTGTHLTYL